MSVANKNPQDNQQISRHEEDDGTVVERTKQSASAGGSASLNLNVAGALSGVFSSKSSKETQEDGTEVEYKEQQAGVKGAGAGSANAKAAAGAQEYAKHERGLEE